MFLELMNFFVVYISSTDLTDQTEVVLKGWERLLYENKSVSPFVTGDVLDVILVTTGLLRVFASL